MYKLISFDQWGIDEDTPYGSGASEKHWLINAETGQRGIFKFPKGDKVITGEYWAEKLAYEIAKSLGIEAAKVDIGTFNNRRGSMSYMLLEDDDEELIEGIQYITKIYPNYDPDRFLDPLSNEIYSIQMIFRSLNNLEVVRENFIKIPLFDCLIGNSDRHHSNWAIVKNLKDNRIRLSPLYDNGSSLCCYVNPDTVDDYMRNEQRFRSLIYGKSKSLIGWENTFRIRHFDLYENLFNNYFEECEDFISMLEKGFDDNRVNKLVDAFDDDIMDARMKQIVKRFLLERRNFMISKYKERKEARS